MPISPSDHRFLLVSRIGPHSLHRQWLAPAVDRNFDVLLSSYDPAMPAPDGEGVFFEHRAGSKVAGYAAVLAAHRPLWRQYRYVAIFDDDLLADATTITRLFDIVAAHDLKIAQPALTRDSHYSYASLLQHPGLLLRYCTYVEMMCPVFRTDILERILPVFDMGYESGIDLVWGNLVHEGPRDFAVVDATPVRHTRRVGTGKAANGFGAGQAYEQHIHAILARFGLPWLPSLPYGAVDLRGRYRDGRGATVPGALALLPAALAMVPRKRRLRNLAAYYKHLLTAPARNIRVDWPADVSREGR